MKTKDRFDQMRELKKNDLVVRSSEAPSRTSDSRFKPIAIIACAVLLITILFGAGSIMIERKFLQTHSYFFDPVYYSFYNARLAVRLPQQGSLSLAREEWLTNGRHPLRTIPLLLFSPKSLSDPMGHMVTALPMMAVFFFMLGWTVYSRTKSLPYATASLLLLGGARGVFNPNLGLGAYWLDLPAAFLVAAAALALINSSEGRNLKWLAAFALFASLATLNRYAAIVDIVVISGPILVFFMVKRLSRERSFSEAIVKPAAVILAVIALTSGYFLAAHFKQNMDFYRVYGYALGGGIKAAAISNFLSLATFIGKPGAAGFFLVAAGGLLLSRKNGSFSWSDCLSVLWLPGSILFYLIFLAQVSGHATAVVYIVPLLVFMVAAPGQISKPGLDSRTTVVLTLMVSIIGLLVSLYGFSYGFRLASYSQKPVREAKKFDIALAGKLARLGDRIVWNAYFDEYAWIPTMETYYRYSKLPLPAGQPFYNAHLSAWHGDYPGLSPAKISRRIYKANAKWVDVAIVLSDPDTATKNSWMNNNYSREIAKYMAQRIPRDKHWRKAFTVKSTRYGTLYGYLNLSSKGRGYTRALATGLDTP